MTVHTDTVLAVITVAMNLLSGWAAMDYSEATQAKTQGHDAYWVSPKVLAKTVIPALSVCHVVLAILKYYFTVVTNTFDATVIAPASWVSEKLYWELKLAMFALATWNLLTSVCSVVAVSRYGQATLGRLALVTVAGMALVGATLQFYPLNNIILAHSKAQSMCDDCPDLGYFIGSDVCTEYDSLTGLVATMFGSWIVNVLLVISAWTLSEERQEVGDTVHGPDVSAGRHAKTLLTANHWLCNVLGVLAGCYLLQFVVYAYSDESYPDTVYAFIGDNGNPDTTESDAAGVLPKEGDGMVQKRWVALLSACLTAAVVVLDWIGRERSVHDADRVASYTKFLLAGTVLVSYMVTVSFVQVRQRVGLGFEHLPAHPIIPVSSDTRWVPGPALDSHVLGLLIGACNPMVCPTSGLRSSTPAPKSVLARPSTTLKNSIVTLKASPIRPAGPSPMTRVLVCSAPHGGSSKRTSAATTSPRGDASSTTQPSRPSCASVPSKSQRGGGSAALGGPRTPPRTPSTVRFSPRRLTTPRGSQPGPPSRNARGSARLTMAGL